MINDDLEFEWDARKAEQAYGGRKPLFIVVTHRMRGEKQVIRLISARRADRAERRFYENEKFQKYRR